MVKHEIKSWRSRNANDSPETLCVFLVPFGYDLICIHPDPRHRPSFQELPQVRVQVKSRYATDCDRGFPVKEASLDAFDFLIVVFLNIGKFFGRNDGSA